MNKFKNYTLATAVCALFIGAVPVTTHGTSAFDLSATALQEVARARGATAKYHDVARAEADGYINIGFCEPGEGCHWVKPSLIDADFDPEQPEGLLYAPAIGESGMRLVGVEYFVPLVLSSGAPAGFSGDADVWRQDTEGFGLWELTAWIWLHNPNGTFEQHNARVP